MLEVNMQSLIRKKKKEKEKRNILFSYQCHDKLKSWFNHLNVLSWVRKPTGITVLEIRFALFFFSLIILLVSILIVATISVSFRLSF